MKSLQLRHPPLCETAGCPDRVRKFQRAARPQTDKGNFLVIIENVLRAVQVAVFIKCPIQMRPVPEQAFFCAGYSLP